MWKYLLAALLLTGAAQARDFSPPPRQAPAPGPALDMTISALRGELAVRDRCSSCHAIGLHDVSPNPTAPPLRAVGVRYPIDNLERAFADGFRISHNPTMPAFTLRPDETADIIAYLKDLHQQDPSRDMAW